MVLAAAGGVDGAEDQVAGLGGVDAGLEGFAVAHLADQDDVGVLADRVLEGRLPVGDVEADLALVDDRLLVGEDELDRVLDGQDVHRFALVDVVEHRGDGGALAAAGDAGQDDHALVEVAELLDRRRQAQLLEGGNLSIDAPGHQAEAGRAA